VSPRCAGRRQGGDTHLPSALRAFLLTLAVVDDLLAITVIAVFYTEHINIVALAAALVPLAVFALCVQRGVQAWWLLIPLAVATWVLMHESGVHATVAGVLLGFAVPVRRSATRRGVQIDAGMAEHFEHRLRPISAGVAIPVFAFFAAGVSLGGASGLARAFTDPITLGIVLGLVEGKPVGIFSSPGCWPRRRGPIWTPTCGGSMWWAFRCWRGSASRCPC